MVPSEEFHTYFTVPSRDMDRICCDFLTGVLWKLSKVINAGWRAGCLSRGAWGMSPSPASSWSLVTELQKMPHQTTGRKDEDGSSSKELTVYTCRQTNLWQPFRPDHLLQLSKRFIPRNMKSMYRAMSLDQRLEAIFFNSHTSSDFSEHNLHDFLEEASLTHFCLYLHYSTQSLDFFFRGKEQFIRKWNALEMLRNKFFWFRKKKSTIKTATQCSTPAIKSRQLLKNLILAGPTFLAFRMVNHVSEWLIH